MKETTKDLRTNGQDGRSCFSWCFSSSPVHEYVDEPVASSVRSTNKAAVPIDTSRDQEDELHIKGKSRTRSKPKQQVLQDVVLINSSINQSQTPMLSPMIVTESAVATATAAILQSPTSLPEPKIPMLRAAEATRDGYLGPAVGLSVLVATLAAMLLCGRVFAVLCLCTFLYLVPLLLTTVAREAGGEAKRKKKYMEVDMNSEEYKKKVVLEGLLERNRSRRY